jgi:hypothetical protein
MAVRLSPGLTIYVTGAGGAGEGALAVATAATVRTTVVVAVVVAVAVAVVTARAGTAELAGVRVAGLPAVLRFPLLPVDWISRAATAPTHIARTTSKVTAQTLPLNRRRAW